MRLPWVTAMVENWVQDKVVVITGGAGGIGAALAWKFGREGARVALIDVDEGKSKTGKKSSSRRE